MQEDDEVLDVVDGADNVIGTIKRGEYYRLESEQLGYIRACELFIMNDKGQLWIPTRTADKKIAPNGLDYSAGGHVSAGEDYLTSGLREIQEELNLDLAAEDLTEVHTFSPTAGLPYFRRLYLYRSNRAPEYNTDDFASAEWLSPEEVLQKIDAGVPAKTSLRATVRYLADYLADTGQPATLQG